jgi:hypothetical protein
MAVLGQARFGQTAYGELPILGTGGSIEISGELWRCDINGQLLEDLSGLLVSANVDWSYDRGGGLFGSFSGTMLQSTVTIRDVRALMPLIDFYTLFLNLDYQDVKPARCQQLGVYAVDPCQEEHDALEGRCTVIGQALTSVLRDNFFTSTFTASTGTQFDTQIRTIIEGAGITRHNIRSSSRTLGYPRKFGITWNRLAAANKLAHAAGWYRLFDELDGRVTTLPYRTNKTTEPAAIYTLADPVNPLNVEPQSKPANTVIVYAQRQGRSTLRSVAMNSDETDPYSVPSLGRQKVYNDGPIVYDDVEDQAALDAIALDLLEEAGSYEQVVTLQVLPDIHPDILRSVVLNFGGEKEHLDGQYACRGWSVGFTPDTALMTLELHRVVRGSEFLESLL